MVVESGCVWVGVDCVLISGHVSHFSDYKEYHTDTTVRFVVNLGAEKMSQAEKIGFHKKFKLESSLSLANMVSYGSAAYKHTLFG